MGAARRFGAAEQGQAVSNDGAGGRESFSSLYPTDCSDPTPGCETTDRQHVRTETATPERWEDVVAVMGTRGDPSHCWCQFFRLRGKDWKMSTRSHNKALLSEQVRGADPPGVIAYVKGEPVGWCAVAPKISYPRVLASPVSNSDTDGIWSITCFVVKVGSRRVGVASRLLEAAVELARSAGAKTVEGYPVDPTGRASVTASELFHGTLSLFLRAGFHEVRRPYPARALVQLSLSPES